MHFIKGGREATKNAYAPYSKFVWGQLAWVGELVSGSNQENASYPAGISPNGFCCQQLLLFFLVFPSKQLLLVIAVRNKE